MSMTTASKNVLVRSTANNRVTKTTVAQAKVALAQVQAGARERTLTDGDIDAAVAAYRDGRNYASRDPDIDQSDVRVALHAEGVPNSYKYAAEATSVYVNESGIQVVRGKARQGKRATSQQLVVTMPCPDGKKAAEMSPMTLNSDERRVYPRKYADRLVFES